MANAKPYYTTDQLVESVKRRISYPLSQNTFQYSDIVAFLNEELQLSAVPAVKMEHEEYFVYKKTVPLVDGISRYEIPDRAIGMALRDVKYSDVNGNFYDMTRIAPDDKAFFQQSNGSNQTVAKFYIEGNEIVLTPLVQAGASGNLNFFFYLRPNSLVRDDRACIIQNFQKEFTVSNTDLQVGDKFIISTGVQSPAPVSNTFIAINGNTGNVTSISTSGVVTTVNPHNIPLTQSVNITFSNVLGLVPNLNGTQLTAVSTGANTLQLSTAITNAGTGGTYFAQSILSISTDGILTTANPHNLPVDQSVNITFTGVSGILPNLNNTVISAVSTGPSTFKLSNTFTNAGTGGNYSIQNSFQIATSNLATAASLFDAINVASITNVTATDTSTPSPAVGKVKVSYKDISVNFAVLKGAGNTNPEGITYDQDNTYINFDQLPTSYTDPETDIETTLYNPNGTSYVDFLQTNPGHRTYTYDVRLVSVNGTVGAFATDDLKTYQNNSSGGELTFYNIKIGDYICLQNECIIPQIPPELHNALAERAASRVLMAIGDMQGYQISQAKIAEMNKMQETLIGSRIESSVPKVFNRYSLLRLGKSRFRRRY
jgi:hypothetical protein